MNHMLTWYLILIVFYSLGSSILFYCPPLGDHPSCIQWLISKISIPMKPPNTERLRFTVWPPQFFANGFMTPDPCWMIRLTSRIHQKMLSPITPFHPMISLGESAHVWTDPSIILLMQPIPFYPKLFPIVFS